MKSLQQIVKQAQEMQERLQQEMNTLEIEASSGGGMVIVRMNGARQILSLKIDPEAVDPNEVEMLQDLIVAAINEACRQVEERLSSQLGHLAGSIKLPGLT
jgi:DNA-binding YbaB/EbfC family protein